MERTPAPSRAAGWLSWVNAVVAAAWLGMVAGHLLPAGFGPGQPVPATRPAAHAPARPQAERAADPAREEWAWPLAGDSRVSSPFGPRDGGLHHGVDLAAEQGTPVRAVLPGVVRRAGWRGAYGLAVEIEHAAGFRTLYAHLSEIRVEPGQRVEKGTVIGWVGATGNATGPHLHLEVRRHGVWYDPLRWLARGRGDGDGTVRAGSPGRDTPPAPPRATGGS